MITDEKRKLAQHLLRLKLGEVHRKLQQSGLTKEESAEIITEILCGKERMDDGSGFEVDGVV